MENTNKGVLKPKTFSIEWKIKDFFANCENVGDEYESKVFPIRYANKLTNWFLRVFPMGENEDYENNVTLHLCFESDDVSEVTVTYRLSIVNQHNKQSFNEYEETVVFNNTSCDFYRVQEFAEHSDIKDKRTGALIDDTLIILCEITFHQFSINVEECFTGYDNLVDEIADGFKDYETLLEDSHFSDVTFDVQGKKIYLHKAILMCRNSVFKAMFENGTGEERLQKKQKLMVEEVEIEDVDYEVMKELFRFIYCGKVKNIEKIAKDLLIAAEKYSVTQLTALCEKTLYENLKVDNAIECLKVTEMCNTIYLKKLVIQFIVDHAKDIVPKCDFKLLFAELDREVVCEIMQGFALKK